MNTVIAPRKPQRNNFLKAVVVVATLLLYTGCSTTRLEKFNRAEVPEVDTSIPVTVSEIREIKYYPDRKEETHKDLHVAGQIFTKSETGGITQIKPCGKCIVKLSIPADTSTHINITTESDGYFTFHGENKPYVLELQMGGHNRVYIGPVDFTTKGITVFKIINAPGNGTESFAVNRNNKNYSWQ